jgi:murein DD-endopeptidase MepM/ murein hydrolase activator NlpD
MASIYESPGQQVALTGSQTSPSFQPGVAYDPSRMMLQQSERDLTAFAQFSDTLTKFITDRAKEKNKEAYLRGLTGLANKQTSLKPEVIQDQKNKAELLRQGAEEEIKVANAIATTDPIQAERYYNRAPARNGWEAYGAAVREAQTIAGGSRSFFSQYYASNDPKDAIQIPGTGRTITPAQAVTDEELAAVDAAAGVAFMLRNKLDTFTPALIAEFVLPRMDEGRAEALAVRTREMLSNNRQIKLDKLDVELSKSVQTLNTQENIQGSVKSMFSAVFGVTRNWKEANEWMQTNLFPALKKATSLGLPGDEALIAMYENSPISDDPSLGTLGDRYEEDFAALRNISKSAASQREKDKAEDTKKRFDGILSAVTLVQQTGDLTQAQRAYDKAESEILALSKDFPVESSIALGTLRSTERNYSKSNEELIIQTIKDPEFLEALRIKGMLSEDGFKEAMENVPTSSSKKKVGDIGNEFKASIAAQLAEKIIGKGIDDPASAKAVVQPFANQLTNEVAVEILAMDARERAEGRTLTEAKIRDLYKELSDKKLQTNPRFIPKVENGVLVNQFNPTDNESGTIKFESGRTVQELVNIATSKLPKVTSPFSPSLSRENLVNNIEAIKASPTGKADERVNVLAAAANMTPLAFLQAQASLPANKGVDVSGLNSSTAAQAYQENFKLDPAAAMGLANPRNNASQREGFRRRLEQARNRQAFQQTQQGPALEVLRSNLIQKEGGAKGYNAANRGGANDTQEGIAGLESMTFAQVKKLQQQGYNAVGAYQFTPNTLKAVQAAAGISDSAPFNKENQDRLFEAVLFNGANNRTRLADFVNGRSNDIRGAVEDFSNEFAAAFNPSGGSRYTGTAGNRPSLDVTQMLRNIREERMGRGNPVNMSTNNIISINLEESGKDSFQPGFDLGFKDFRFGAVLPGRVKEIRRNAGNYGNLIVVESSDPATGEPLDVVYAHLASIAVAPGQSIKPGQFLGMEGGTGRVKSSTGTIASVDFLAPAPVGSNSKTAYRNWRALRDRLVQQINSGGIR